MIEPELEYLRKASRINNLGVLSRYFDNVTPADHMMQAERFGWLEGSGQFDHRTILW